MVLGDGGGGDRNDWFWGLGLGFWIGLLRVVGVVVGDWRAWRLGRMVWLRLRGFVGARVRRLLFSSLFSWEREVMTCLVIEIFGVESAELGLVLMLVGAGWFHAG